MFGITSEASGLPFAITRNSHGHTARRQSVAPMASGALLFISIDYTAVAVAQGA